MTGLMRLCVVLVHTKKSRPRSNRENALGERILNSLETVSWGDIHVEEIELQ